jgi:N6-L-threonylcarbamoyladenine synthase
VGQKASGPLLTLGIETSCDETAASVVADGREIRSSIVASQLVHSQYGGVVPELASRAHMRLIMPVVKTALDVAGAQPADLSLVAATYAPGLLGALLVGLPFAKAVAWSLGIPFVGVNHVEGHVFAVFLEFPRVPLPMLSLVVSGGHTELILVKDRCSYEMLGATLDDACGEAFDKAAKLLGFPYPGGAFVETHARDGARTVRFPVPQIPGLDFSFSGLKTALLYYLQDAGLVPRTAKSQIPAPRALLAPREGSSRNTGPRTPMIADICHSFQETLIDFLLVKLAAAAEETGVRRIGVSGGVAVNGRLRERLTALARKHDFTVYFPPVSLCTDNAAMIAACGHERYSRYGASLLSLPALSREDIGPEPAVDFGPVDS